MSRRFDVPFVIQANQQIAFRDFQLPPNSKLISVKHVALAPGNVVVTGDIDVTLQSAGALIRASGAGTPEIVIPAQGAAFRALAQKKKVLPMVQVDVAIEVD